MERGEGKREREGEGQTEIYCLNQLVGRSVGQSVIACSNAFECVRISRISRIFRIITSRYLWGSFLNFEFSTGNY